MNPVFDEEARRRTFEHAMEIWFEPEIRRRQEAGLISKPFLLRAAQVITYADGRRNEIRLNEEVRAIGDMKLKTGITKEPGELVYPHEVEEVPLIRLPDTEDPNCGHFTLLLLADRWYGSFDFRYNRGKAAELLSAADEFYAAANYALSCGGRRAAVDNLFSAAELAAKAYVMAIPLPGGAESKSHGVVHARFNMLARNGNIESEQREAFNALADARARARYPSGPLVESEEQIKKWTAGIGALIATVRARNV